MIVEHFKYQEIIRDTHPSGYRVYHTPTGTHPSVTTVLDRTSDKSGLEAWKAWIGEEKAAQVSKEATDLGTLMHAGLENYLLGQPRPGGSNLIRKKAADMADVIIENGLKNVTEVWGVEVPLYYPGLYAGTTDLVGIHDGDEAIMDFKTTKKPKKLDQILNYIHQLTAYSLAHNEVYGTNIRKGVIFMVSRDLKYQEFTFTTKDFDKHAADWARRVENFYTQVNNT
jgi:genome maintenance exonuclease 1